MSWAFLDDRANENEKLVAVGGAAAWYWACGLMYCRRKEAGRRARGERLDFIPSNQALVLFPDGRARAHVKALVGARLWLAVDGGYQVNDYAAVYGSDGSNASRRPAEAQPAGPAGVQPKPSQLGGKARVAGASRGPAGRFQPGQLRARQDPDPTPEDPTEKPSSKDLKDSPAGEAPAGDSAGRLDLDYRTECPPRLVELCNERGIIASLAQEHGVRGADVEEAIRQYADHFTKGRGFGEKREHWMRQVRGRVLNLHRAGNLAGIAPARPEASSTRAAPTIERDARPAVVSPIPADVLAKMQPVRAPRSPEDIEAGRETLRLEAEAERQRGGHAEGVEVANGG